MKKNIVYKDGFLSNWLKNSEHFEPQQYYEKLCEIFPESKSKWDELKPTESDIHNAIINMWDDYYTYANAAVLDAEQKLGIKIDPEYKFPNNMTYAEYERWVYNKYFLWTPGLPRELFYDNEYFFVWLKMHFDDAEMVKNLFDDWAGLCELNPVLKNITANNEFDIHMAIRGAASGEPWQDIEYFNQVFIPKITDYDKYNEIIKPDRIAANIPPDFEFHWLLSPETIREIGEKLNTKFKVKSSKFK